MCCPPKAWALKPTEPRPGPRGAGRGARAGGGGGRWEVGVGVGVVEGLKVGEDLAEVEEGEAEKGRRWGRWRGWWRCNHKKTCSARKLAQEMLIEDNPQGPGHGAQSPVPRASPP
ncbi:hypothetical protein CYMTET_38467 [Cymbomonas tetramitiformis]|uniref:Uncharacterized protein n=1 Tax=Cymbomonas tetramitiformis TaxID=36881 RepID=A0AAE0CDI4_9CHLO|nr:hypothetical protein CYMTET_38467 [Cymbomonas tetramitiformis]